MTTDPDHELDQHLRAVAHALIAQAPDPPAMPEPEHHGDHHERRRPVLMVAATVAVISSAGLLAMQLGDRDTATVGDRPDTPSSGLQAPTVLVTPVPAPSTPTMGPFVYEAGPGQTLADIAEDVCLTPEAIASDNGWADGISHIVVPLEVINIPEGGCDPSADEPTGPSPTMPSGNTSSVEQRYVVVKGDSIYHIATRFGISIDELAAYNQWSDNHSLFEGDIVLIPPGARNLDEGSLPTTSLLVGGPLLTQVARNRRRD